MVVTQVGLNTKVLNSKVVSSNYLRWIVEVLDTFKKVIYTANKDFRMYGDAKTMKIAILCNHFKT